MYDEAKLLEFFQQRDIMVSGRIAADIFRQSHFYVFVDVVRDRDNHQVPSNKSLLDAKLFLQQEGVYVDFVLTDAEGHDIEAGFRASMLHSFGQLVRNAFLTIQGNAAIAWIVPKANIESTVQSEIELKTEIFLRNYDLKLKELSLTSVANIPSKLACLQAIRVAAPLEPEALTAALRQKDFVVPSENWTNRMLDSLRKGGLVVRLKSGGYVLSLTGIKALGTSKSRRSPDVIRMLALAKSGD